METNAELDKWAAEKCGVRLIKTPSGFSYKKDELFIGEWTLSDARCREIVREHFKILTKYCSSERWSAETYIYDAATVGVYETIAEAEIACIAAIMEAEDGN